MSTVTAMIWPEENRQLSYSQPKQTSRPVRQLDIEQHSSFSGEASKAEMRGLNEEQLLALTGRMVHGVAHDIRHYMTAVLANTDVMDDPRMSPNTRAEVRQDVRDAISDICKMLDLALLCARHILKHLLQRHPKHQRNPERSLQRRRILVPFNRNHPRRVPHS